MSMSKMLRVSLQTVAMVSLAFGSLLATPSTTDAQQPDPPVGICRVTAEGEVICEPVIGPFASTMDDDGVVCWVTPDGNVICERVG